MVCAADIPAADVYQTRFDSLVYRHILPRGEYQVVVVVVVVVVTYHCRFVYNNTNSASEYDLQNIVNLSQFAKCVKMRPELFM